MDTPKNKMEMTDEKRKLRNSHTLFEFYRSLTALNVVLVDYVQSDKHHFKTDDANREVEAYSSSESKRIEERAAKATGEIQELIRQFQNGHGCGAGQTWDPATQTCG